MKNTNFSKNNPHKRLEVKRNISYYKLSENQNPAISYHNFPGIVTNTKKIQSQPAWISPHYLHGNIINSGLLIKLNESTAVKLAKIIIQNTDINSFPAATGKRRSNNVFFYSLCALSNNISSSVIDNDILLLYFKQIFLILKNTGMFNNRNVFNEIKGISFEFIQLYLMLLDSFWNRVKWEELFPSMPEYAKKLKANKKALIELILCKKDKFRIDSISNAFSAITGVGKYNDIFFISFMDFYCFTWLSHFGIINYLKGDDSDPVEIMLTENGRIILDYLTSE